MDAPFHIVLNTGSGKQEPSEVENAVEAELRAAGRSFTWYRVEDPTRLDEIASSAVAAASADGGVVVAAGGDGTINAVARATLGSGCAFGVLPLGTFNYFSRAHGIPSDVPTACRILLTAQPHPVQLGQVNERVFLVNASLGLYPKLLEEREEAERRLGRSRFVSFAAALTTLLRSHRHLRLLVVGKNGQRELVTPTLFVGNNRLQLQRVGLPEAELVERHRLVALAPKPLGRWGWLGLMLRAMLGKLGDADDLVVLDFERLTVRPRFGSRRIKVATDGEVTWLPAPLTFRVAPHPLLLLRYDDAGEDPG